jgi:dTDP-4-dehydrorhamnose 3,5-epimerase
MNIIKTDIPEVLIFEPRVFGDARGFSLKASAARSLMKQWAQGGVCTG